MQTDRQRESLNVIDGAPIYFGLDGSILKPLKYLHNTAIKGKKVLSAAYSKTVYAKHKH